MNITQGGLATRGRLTVRGCDIHDFMEGAGLHLRENTDVLVQGNRIHGNRSGVRARGAETDSETNQRTPSTRVTAVANVFFDNESAVRCEDGLEFLRLFRNTFGLGNHAAFEQAGGATADLQLLDNLVVGAGLPEEARGGGNLSCASEAVVDAVGRDYHLAPGSPAIDAGLPLPSAYVDADGRPQVGSPDVGAYEAR